MLKRRKELVGVVERLTRAGRRRDRTNFENHLLFAQNVGKRFTPNNLTNIVQYNSNNTVIA